MIKGGAARAALPHRIRRMNQMIDCGECERLQTEAAASWQDYLAEKHLNSTRSKDPDRNLARQDELLKSYRLMAARQRVHQAQAHPDQGSRLRVEDLEFD